MLHSSINTCMHTYSVHACIHTLSRHSQAQPMLQSFSRSSCLESKTKIFPLHDWHKSQALSWLVCQYRRASHALTCLEEDAWKSIWGRSGVNASAKQLRGVARCMLNLWQILSHAALRAKAVTVWGMILWVARTPVWIRCMQVGVERERERERERATLCRCWLTTPKMAQLFF